MPVTSGSSRPRARSGASCSIWLRWPPTPPSGSRRRSPAGSPRRPGSRPRRRSRRRERSHPRRAEIAAEPEHDVVLLGATGFTGGLTAEYLAEHADPGTRWAIAGRNRRKLDAVRARLGETQAELPLLAADTSDPESMRRMAESARVVITTVGPYINYG